MQILTIFQTGMPQSTRHKITYIRKRLHFLLTNHVPLANNIYEAPCS